MSAPKAFLKARAGVVLIHEDRLLLMRQNNKPFWVFPGGTLEPNEGLAECAERELLEEAELTVRIGPLLYLTDFIDRPNEPGGRQVVDSFFAARYLSGPTEWRAPYPENIDEIAWFSRSELNTLAVLPSDIKAAVLTDWELLLMACSANPESSDMPARYLGVTRRAS